MYGNLHYCKAVRITDFVHGGEIALNELPSLSCSPLNQVLRWGVCEQLPQLDLSTVIAEPKCRKSNDGPSF
jgi:hypothetical protein